MLLDLNNDPKNTVYYYAAVAYGYLSANDGIDFVALLKGVSSDAFEGRTNLSFFSLGLDFLFLLDKIFVDDKGGLHANKKLENS